VSLMYRRVEIEFHGRPLSIEVGRLAKQAHGAALVSYGETVLLATAVAAVYRRYPHPPIHSLPDTPRFDSPAPLTDEQDRTDRDPATIQHPRPTISWCTPA
jgi:hypothetical protein